MSRIQKGFTLIELLIVVAILGILAAIVAPVFMVGSSPSVSIGVTGWTEERCIGGFKFVTGNRGAPAQILDAQGHGIACR